jgi:hypothetical protein
MAEMPDDLPDDPFPEPEGMQEWLLMRARRFALADAGDADSPVYQELARNVEDIARRNGWLEEGGEDEDDLPNPLGITAGFEEKRQLLSEMAQAGLVDSEEYQRLGESVDAEAKEEGWLEEPGEDIDDL